ncbi:ABC transporter ATP-binding protein [Fusobacterium sp. PH5-44]|uniref:ABC transporter ATP-binding protein n=1 Tax=unclassified Fusobacterium TaxID=2648384 RepID=UPI003D19DA55
MLLEARNLNISFRKESQKKIFGKERQLVVKNVSLNLIKGECLGIIGESGSGKSTLGKSLIGILKPDNGAVLIDGKNIYSSLTKEEKVAIKKKISVVFQDYTSSVNPRFRIISIIGEALQLKSKRDGKSINLKSEIIKLLEVVGLDESFIYRYPHELSGGQLQRVCIARAIATDPEIILLDEAISSLDASIQVQVMDLLLELKDKYNFSYIFITHDLPSVTYMCNRVIFFYNGEIVEKIDKIEDLGNVRNEYAQKLLSSVLDLEI